MSEVIENAVEEPVEKMRKPVLKTVMIEVYDNEGNVIENAGEKNFKIVATFKKVDESVIDLIKEHPHAFFAKI